MKFLENLFYRQWPWPQVLAHFVYVVAHSSMQTSVAHPTSEVGTCNGLGVELV